MAGESVAFSYDGVDTLTATVTAANPGDTYLLDVEGAPGGTDFETAVGSTLVLTVGLSGGTPGDMMDAHVVNDTEDPGDFDYIGWTLFVYGSAPEFPYATTWAYDGDKTITCGPFTGENGVDYAISVFDQANGGTDGTPETGTGAPMTLTLTLTLAPTSTGDYFRAQLFDGVSFDPSYYHSVRLFTPGLAGAGFLGNPIPPPPIAPPTQVFGGTRFYEAPPWRLIVGDLEDNTLTFLDRLAFDRSVTVTRAAARVISGRVPSDNPEVNIPAPDPDGEPFLSEGTRIVSCFRREAPPGVSVGKVLKADATVADAYANFDFPTDQSEIWITCRFACAQAFIDSGNSATLVRTGSVFSSTRAGVLITTDDDENPVWLLQPGFPIEFGGTPLGDTWQLLEMHYLTDGSIEFYVDGTLTVTHTSDSPGDTEAFQLGQQSGSNDLDAVVYFDDVKVGTTRGSSDVFADDFEDGTLDAWTSTEGDVSVIDDPFTVAVSSKPWVIRARGLVLSLTDDADSDHATSTFTAYDPWKYWYRLPMRQISGDVGDVSYPAGTRANEIIIEQFDLAILEGTLFTDYGQTAFYGGTIENTEPLPDGGDGLAMTFRAGTTLGEMCDLLVATGTCDIVNDPIYDVDPGRRPGLLTETSIYQSAGSFRPNAVMGWDRWPRSLVGLSRQVDGTERANIVQMYAGQGGPPVPLEEDAASIARFGRYWALQYLPGVPSLAGAHTIAQRQVVLLKDGLYTYALSPSSERAPLLFQEYREADTVPVYADERFRDPISGVPVRVESIPIVIGDDQLERVNQMLVSFAPESGS